MRYGLTGSRLFQTTDRVSGAGHSITLFGPATITITGALVPWTS
jgi:hypothetical protein